MPLVRPADGTPVRALVDRHHADLFYGLQRLFEDRLGYTVVTPIGHAWWDAGYWRFGEGYGDDRLARQFLDMAGWASVGYGLYVAHDDHHPDRRILGVMEPLPVDVVVATVQDNQAGFARLAPRPGAPHLSPLRRPPPPSTPPPPPASRSTGHSTRWSSTPRRRTSRVAGWTSARSSTTSRPSG